MCQPRHLRKRKNEEVHNKAVYAWSSALKREDMMK